MKVRAFSNADQMHEMQGSYSGIDMLNITGYGRYDFMSKLHDFNQAIMILGRKDIRGLIS